jgi:hypothetical protein
MHKLDLDYSLPEGSETKLSTHLAPEIKCLSTNSKQFKTSLKTVVLIAD